MEVVLSHHGMLSAVKQKVFRREVAHVLVMTLLACALFLVLQHAAFAGATKDLLKVGDDAVKGTFGQDSSLMKWLLIGEVVVAIATYIGTRSFKVLGGIIVLSVFINVAFAIIG
jgi:type IV conjugative transfer system pilin TraA